MYLLTYNDLIAYGRLLLVNRVPVFKREVAHSQHNWEQEFRARIEGRKGWDG
jgi:hypothetical protein